ncbi:hypothetical protein SCX93_14900, partial [Legionella pneumophila serogroup 1]
NIDRIWLSLNFDFFMQNLLAYTLRENSTFGSNYFAGGLPFCGRITITIEVIEGSQVLSLDDISVHRYQELKQWDFDFISFSNNEHGNIIEEELI